MPLKIVVPGLESYDDVNEVFVYGETTDLVLEHSLVSLSRWESKWEKPFLSDTDKTPEETLSYIQLMSIDDEIPRDVLERLGNDNLKSISDYIESKMTATWFNENAPTKKAREVVTSEIIYYWMFSMSIPKECENWHLRRLITLIKTISEKNQPEKKMSRADIIARNKALNAQRKAKYNTPG